MSEQELTGSFDGADYRCLTAEASATEVGMCMWRANDHMGIVMGVDGDAASTQALTGRMLRRADPLRLRRQPKVGRPIARRHSSLNQYRNRSWRG